MKIGVLSDTHIPGSADSLPGKIIKCFRDCDLIVHAGDICEKFVIDELNEICQVKAVCGNMDSVSLKTLLPEKMVFEFAGKRIGLIHGRGSGEGVLDYAKDAFKGQKLDLVVFGHSHLSFSKKIGQTVYFNPGSPTDVVFSPIQTFGIITIQNGQLKTEIIDI